MLALLNCWSETVCEARSCNDLLSRRMLVVLAKFDSVVRWNKAGFTCLTELLRPVFRLQGGFKSSLYFYCLMLRAFYASLSTFCWNELRFEFKSSF